MNSLSIALLVLAAAAAPAEAGITIIIFLDLVCVDSKTVCFLKFGSKDEHVCVRQFKSFVTKN